MSLASARQISISACHGKNSQKVTEHPSRSHGLSLLQLLLFFYIVLYCISLYNYCFCVTLVIFSVEKLMNVAQNLIEAYGVPSF